MKTVIMCGGGGTRLWPLSRLNMPKQFAQLSSDKNELSLFQQTLLRNQNFTNEFLIVVNKNQLHLAQSQVEDLGLAQSVRYLSEPFGRNTAAVIALAAQMFDSKDNVLVVPSDHHVKEVSNYHGTIEQSYKFLEQNKIVLFGIQPTRPETGFGYIEFNGNEVVSFKEKPNLETAKKYVQSGEYLWNGGIFAFKNETIVNEFKKHLPKTLQVAEQINNHQGRTTQIAEALMSQFENISIDFGVIEKSEKLAILNASNWQWTDLGSFESLAEMDQDHKKSKVKTSVHTLGGENNFVISDKEVVLIGQSDLLVIDTGDALLISKKGLSSEVKNVLPNLSKPDLAKNHLTVVRPWGSYTVLEDGPNYKVKSIIVKPEKRLSLQKHKFRAEVWTVVKGVATVTIDEKTFDLTTNETCFIPQGSVHRLTNKTSTPVEIIEIQTGSSFDEDDIIRLEDDFNRI